jgi:hypothetical protein
VNVPIEIVRKGKAEECVRLITEKERLISLAEKAEEDYDTLLGDVFTLISVKSESPFYVKTEGRRIADYQEIEHPLTVAIKLSGFASKLADATTAKTSAENDLASVRLAIRNL